MNFFFKSKYIVLFLYGEYKVLYWTLYFITLQRNDSFVRKSYFKISTKIKSLVVIDVISWRFDFGKVSNRKCATTRWLTFQWVMKIERLMQFIHVPDAYVSVYFQGLINVTIIPRVNISNGRTRAINKGWSLRLRRISCTDRTMIILALNL